MLLSSLFAGVKIRTDKENIFSAPYRHLQEIGENKYIGKLNLKTDYGTFEFCDEITVEDEAISISVNCSYTNLAEQVKGVGVYCGANLTDKYDELKFFAPSAWYGDKILFEGKSNKMPFVDGVAGGSIDCIGVPICGAYNAVNKNGCTIEVLNPRYDTSISSKNDVIIDDRTTLSSIGVKVCEQVKLFCAYPATYYHIAGSDRTVEWYLPPKGISAIRAQYKINSLICENFHLFMKKTWRTSYKKYAKVNDGIDTFVARNALLEYVANSFNTISNVPQYMTNVDHFASESGFLYRNADIAYLMLRYGYEVNDKTIIKNAKEVLNTQVDLGFLGENQVFPFERSRAEGCIALLHAYKFLKQKGENNNCWYEYIKSEVERFENINEYYSIPLLCEMDKLDIAIKKAEKIWEQFSNMYFFGGIVDFVDEISVDRESGYLGLYAFLSIYETTKEERWLYRAQFCADYLETYQNLRQNGFHLYETTGNEHYNMASIGNESLRLNGLSFISATCSAGDVINVLAVPLYYKLYRYSGDTHYYEYACLLERNCLEYVDLYNKAGSLTDVLLSSGLGYTSEYFQLAISNDPVCLYTGCAHDANIAWVPYVILNSQQEIFDLTGEYFLAPKKVDVIKMNIASDCTFFCKDREVGNLVSFDFYKRTLFYVGDNLQIDLSSVAENIVISHAYPYKVYNYRMFFLDRQKNIIKTEKLNREARFVNVEIPNDCVKINIEFLDDADIRQIQVFGKNSINKVFEYKIRQEKVKEEKQTYASGTLYNADRQKSFPFDYLYKKNGNYYRLDYDNKKNAYCYKEEEFLQIKTGNLMHPGSEVPAVRSFTVGADGLYNIFCEVSASSYLKNFGGSVMMKIYLNESFIAEKRYVIQRKRSERISIKHRLKKKDVLYFEVWSQEGNNRNCLVINEILIQKESI